MKLNIINDFMQLDERCRMKLSQKAIFRIWLQFTSIPGKDKKKRTVSIWSFNNANIKGVRL